MSDVFKPPIGHSSRFVRVFKLVDMTISSWHAALAHRQPEGMEIWLKYSTTLSQYYGLLNRRSCDERF
jgi:hypothetical protein